MMNGCLKQMNDKESLPNGACHSFYSIYKCLNINNIYLLQAVDYLLPSLRVKSLLCSSLHGINDFIVGAVKKFRFSGGYEHFLPNRR